MKAVTVLVSSLLASVALARDFRHVNKPELNKVRRVLPNRDAATAVPYTNSSGSIIPSNVNVTRFAVDGKSIPDVDFDIGESYAGLLPISSSPDASELYFWFFPSANPLAQDEIVIWLNGGPGCSSLEGLLQENGPFLWQYGTYKPVQNIYSWVNLTNVVWIEQPAGTGFSKIGAEGAPQNELDVAKQFLGFWKNFVTTFGLQGRKVFITGESYAGYYVPYIADAMHNETNTEYYNIDSVLFYDPSLTYNVIQEDIPAVPFMDQWSGLFALNKTFVDDVHNRWDTCGYKAWYEQALTFPPTGPLPLPPNVDGSKPSCSLWVSHAGFRYARAFTDNCSQNDIYNAVTLVNPCFDIYQIATTCPLLWDVLGFPGSIPYLPDGAEIYFNRTDVQKAINAPQEEWEECRSGVLSKDDSPPSALSVLPRVIEKNTRTIIGHGQLDYVLISNGALAAIQNMTWNGSQGFSNAPSTWQNFFVPYHPDPLLGDIAGAGDFGAWNTERGLTFCTIDLSGHMIPQYAPSAAYRQMEFLLGRISDLGYSSDFTTQAGDFGNNLNVVANSTKIRRA